MEIGEIIDIQMDGTAESYYTDNINIDGEEWREPWELLNSQEFQLKLKEKANVTQAIGVVAATNKTAPQTGDKSLTPF